MFETSGLGAQNEFVIREDDAIQALAQIFADTPVATWRAYLRYHLLRDNASVLPEEFDDATFAFFGTELRGTPKKRERWKRGVAAVNGALGEAVGEVYVKRHFPADSKEKMDELVEYLRLALDERLDTLPWMGEETKVEAHRKLEKFTPKIGYPEKWQDYSDFSVCSRKPIRQCEKRKRLCMAGPNFETRAARSTKTEMVYEPAKRSTPIIVRTGMRLSFPPQFCRRHSLTRQRIRR